MSPQKIATVYLEDGQEVDVRSVTQKRVTVVGSTKTLSRRTLRADGSYVEPVPTPAPTDPQWAVDLRALMTSTPLAYVLKPVPNRPTLTGQELNAAIAAAGNGSRLVIPSGTRIDLSGDVGLNFKSRSNVELIGFGCPVDLGTTGASNFSSAFFFQDSHFITIRGFQVRGRNPNTGTAKGPATVDEQINGAAIRYDSDHIEFDRTEWDDLDGFGIFISSDGGVGGPKWPQGIWLHGTKIRGGEMAYGVVSVRDLIVEDGAIADTNWSPFDFEPDNSTEGYERVLVQRMTIDRFGWEALSGGHTHWLLAANPANSALGAKMTDLTFRQNRVIRGHVPGGGQNAGGGGLLVRFDKANVKDGLTITDNVSDEPRTKAGSPIQGNAVRNAVITGNRQKLVGGAPLYVHGADAVDVPDVNVVAMPNVTA